MKVKLALLFHRHVSGTSTTVNVDDGIVTLTGEVTNQAKKELTSEYAKDIDGVKSVNNKMTVAAVLEPEKRTENEKIDDASVSAQVRTALSIHRSTSNVRTKVEARDGEVTLTGIAKNEAEKSLVTKVVSDVRGVSSVNNMMTIDQVKTK